MSKVKEPAPIVHYSEDNKDPRCSADSAKLYTFQLTKNKNKVTCEECLEFMHEDEVDDKLEEAMEAYDKYMDLRNELIEMDESAADKLADWVDNHSG